MKKRKKVRIPPDVLYHGTGLRFLPSILEKGLLPKGRFVHLSKSIDTARAAGARYGKSFVIEVDTEEMRKAGHAFHLRDGVWLTRAAPAEFLGFEPWERVWDAGMRESFLKELMIEVSECDWFVPKPEQGDLRLVWRRYDCDDCLFLHPSSGVHYMVHLVWSRKPERVAGYPGTDVHPTLDDWIQKGLWVDQQFLYEFDTVIHETKNGITYLRLRENVS